MSTSTLYEKKKYKEEVSSVLISQDNKKLVVIGKDYHYIFDAPLAIVQTLSSSFHHAVTAKLMNFSVDSSSEISGKYTLVLGKNASEQDNQSALKVGYRSSHGNTAIYEGGLLGVRYMSNGIQANTKSHELNKTYMVSITVKSGIGEKVRKILLTPVTVAADGILLIALVPLVYLVGFVFGTLCKTGALDC